MGLPDAGQRTELPELAGCAVGLFADPGNRFRLFREKVLPVLEANRGRLAALYCPDDGRPCIDPVVMAGVTLLQFMEKASDRAAEEHVRLHLGWKYALGLPLDDPGFDHSSLRVFRQRLLRHEAQRLVFDAVLDGLQQAGLVRRRSRQRLDSTHVLGAVAHMGRLECVREALRLFLVDAGPCGLTEPPGGWSRWTQRYIDGDVQWHRLGRPALEQKAREAGQDALELIGWLRLQPPAVRDADSALLLERVFLEQYEPEIGVTDLRAKPGSGAVVNPHDPDVQWATKDLAKTTQWRGYKVQIAETVADADSPPARPQPTGQFVVEILTTPAIVSDIEGLRQVLAAQKTYRQDQPRELYVDAGYVTDDTLAEAQAEHRLLLGPPRPPGNPSGETFTSERFDVDCSTRRAVCPAGHTSRQCSLITDQNTGTVCVRFEWAGLCDACALQRQCTKSRSGRRTLVVGQHHDLLQHRRRQMQDETFRLGLRRRNAIEGTISQFARGGGRRSRYRGRRKTALANYFLGAAINAKRWLRRIQWQLQRQPGAQPSEKGTQT